MQNASRATRSILIIEQNLPVPFDRRVWQEATSLRRAGYNVAVICPKNETYTLSRESLEGVEIYRYKLLVEGDTSLAAYFMEFLCCWVISLFLAIRVYRKRHFDVIHACNPPDTYFALALLFRPLGVKFVFDHHDLCPDLYVAKGNNSRGFVYRCLLWLEYFTFRTADMVIAVNQSHSEIAQRRGSVLPRKIAIVRSGPRRFWAQIDLHEPALKRGCKYMVAYVGQMGKQDGVDYLLRAADWYRRHCGDDTFFVVIGGGPNLPELRRLGRELDLTDTVHFTGHISDEKLWSYLSSADVGIDPDPITEFNNMSTMNKIIEYMSFGLPVVAFNLLEHRRTAMEAAAYVARNDAQELARELRRLIEDPNRRMQMSSMGRARFFETLAWENSERILIAAYDRLLEVEGVPQAAIAAAPVAQRTSQSC